MKVGGRMGRPLLYDGDRQAGGWMGGWMDGCTQCSGGPRTVNGGGWVNRVVGWPLLYLAGQLPG